MEHKHLAVAVRIGLVVGTQHRKVADMVQVLGRHKELVEQILLEHHRLEVLHRVLELELRRELAERNRLEELVASGRQLEAGRRSLLQEELLRTEQDIQEPHKLAELADKQVVHMLEELGLPARSHNFLQVERKDLEHKFGQPQGRIAAELVLGC